MFGFSPGGGSSDGAGPGSAQFYRQLADGCIQERTAPEQVASASWVIEEGDNSIHITQTENGKGKKIELQCTTDGKECKFPGDRRDSFWYNGAILVEMETKSDHVIRYRMKLSDDGKTMTVEVTNIVPQSDKMDTMVFQKQT